VLVEAHTAAEVDRALEIGARIVGVNARDLATFDEHLDAVADVAARIPAETIAVAESAIRQPDDAARMAARGFDAVLVGEALVRSPDPAALAAALGSSTVQPRGGNP
jgi:indole-3-glycerol phosphate synthase